MAKLHELLAVEGPLKAQSDKTRAELLNTFDKKKHHFSEKSITFIPLEEGGKEVREEQLNLQSTIKTELKWIQDIWSKYLNAAYQIAEANTQARADVVLDNGIVVLANVPATALLELEKRAVEIRELVAGIPTLDPAKGFEPDPQKGVNIFKARETNVTRTRKTQQALVLYPATEQHPAQVKEISVDVPTGRVQTQEWSGLITTAEKADMMERAEELTRAIKKARSRANNTEIDSKRTVGAELLSYVFAGSVNRVQAQGEAQAQA